MEDEVVAILARHGQQIEYIEKRQDAHDKLVSAVHELASDVKVMSSNFEQQGRLFEQQGQLFDKQWGLINDIIGKFDDRFRIQGERIGNTPTLEEFEKLACRMTAVENQPLENVKQFKGALIDNIAKVAGGAGLAWVLQELLRAAGVL